MKLLWGLKSVFGSSLVPHLLYENEKKRSDVYEFYQMVVYIVFQFMLVLE